MISREFFMLPFFFLCIQSSLAQELKNIIAEFDGEKMKITYDLIYNNPDQKFNIAAYGSHNNFQTKLENVIGDIGNNVSPGEGKSITWYLLTELPVNYNDIIQVKLIANSSGEVSKTVKRMQFLSPSIQTVGKMGKSMMIQWEGTDLESKYLLELYAGKNKKSDITAITKDQSYRWKVSKKLDKSLKYKIKMTNGQNSMDYIFSPEFSVKAGFPTVLVVVPAAVVAGVAYFVLGSSGNGNNGSENLSDLPVPIDPQ